MLSSGIRSSSLRTLTRKNICNNMSHSVQPTFARNSDRYTLLAVSVNTFSSSSSTMPWFQRFKFHPIQQREFIHNFHYTDPTGLDPTRKSPRTLSGRVRLVEFSYYRLGLPRDPAQPLEFIGRIRVQTETHRYCISKFCTDRSIVFARWC